MSFFIIIFIVIIFDRLEIMCAQMSNIATHNFRQEGVMEIIMEHFFWFFH